MKKRIEIIIIIIIIVIALVGITVIKKSSNSKYTFEQEGIRYALTLDGKKIASFPSKDMYKAQVTCDGADGKWLYDDWKLAIENITSDNVTCDINFSTISKINLSDYIISLAGTTQGTGQVVDENGYRYEGKNPNNYIWFNNEFWRIIGVFDESSHGQSGKNLVKIIRADILDGRSRHCRTMNSWVGSTLHSLLNGAYYNAEDGTNSRNCIGYCTSYQASTGTNCDYTVRGIQSNIREMVASVKWYSGQVSDRGATADLFYESERAKVLDSTSYIGLMYASDYGYSVLASSCARTTGLNAYNSAECAGQSWLYGKGREWTITSYASDSKYAFFLNTGGQGDIMYTSYGYGSRPVLYLDASVYKIDGDGSLNSPYIIGMQ